MTKARKNQEEKPVREDVVKTFDNTPATDSQPAPPIRGDLPPSHTKGEIAAVAAHLLPHLPPEESVASFAIQKAVELLDAAEQASKQRDIERAWLQAEGSPWAKMSFEDGVKIITGDEKHPGRAKETYRRFWEWRRWSLGKHNPREAELRYPEFAKSTPDGEEVTKKMREIMMDEGWFRHEATIWTPQSLEEAKALFDDWKKRGRPEARERRGRPGAFDLRGNSPHPPPTTGRAKEESTKSEGTERKLKK
jgi:hypothetical protein